MKPVCSIRQFRTYRLKTTGCTIALLIAAVRSLAQVGPAEIENPRLKAREHAYLRQLVETSRAISTLKFPFVFSLNRYVGLNPKEQVGADARGLEFVDFHGRSVLKLSGNYNAAFSADRLTPNQRSGRVFNEVITPILGLLPEHFKSDDDFEAFGFEISYHVRLWKHGYDYEGKEILAAILDKADALNYSRETDESKRQAILNRSEIYLDGKPFGLALGTAEPVDPEMMIRPAEKAAAAISNVSDPIRTAAAQDGAPAAGSPTVRPTLPQAKTTDASHALAAVSPISEATAAIDSLQAKYQSRLDILAREGTAKYHFVDYAPPSFVVFHNQVSLQLTIRNPSTFDRESTSLYKRAAQTFDLFLAPELKPILDRMPEGNDFSLLDVTVINGLMAKPSPSSEAVEFILPIAAMRKFVNADITNQELIDQSVVLVNGVRIALNLQQVE